MWLSFVHNIAMRKTKELRNYKSTLQHAMCNSANACVMKLENYGTQQAYGSESATIAGKRKKFVGSF